MGLGNRIGAIFNTLLSRLRWGGDLVPDMDDTQSIGSPTIGIDNLHIAQDFLFRHGTAVQLWLRNSADDDYQGLTILTLHIDGSVAILQAVGDGIVFGGVNRHPQFVSLTTAQKTGVTEAVGMVVFDSDLARLECVLDGTNWESLPATKEKFWGVHAEDTKGDYACHSLVGALRDNFTGKIPHDFIALIAFDLVLIPEQDRIDIHWTTDYAAENEAFATHSGAGNIDRTVAGDTDKIIELTMATAFAGLSADDYFGIEITGSAGRNYNILGIRLRYR